MVSNGKMILASILRPINTFKLNRFASRWKKMVSATRPNLSVDARPSGEFLGRAFFFVTRHAAGSLNTGRGEPKRFGPDGIFPD
jgi:hypothetical protein